MRATTSNRQTAFGLISRPLDGNAKAKLWAKARTFVGPREKFKHHGRLSLYALEVFRALLWRFHNSKSGQCFPGYEKLMKATGFCRETIARSLDMLEGCGLLRVQHRLIRVRVPDPVTQFMVLRPIRTSNSYDLNPGVSEITESLCTGSKSTIQTETSGEDCPSALTGVLSAIRKAIERRKRDP